MKEKKHITKKKLFNKTIQILKPYLNLHDWKIIITHSKRMTDAAECDASPEYKEAIIKLNVNQLQYWTNYEIVSMAIHEMIHCIVWPMSIWTQDLCNGKEKDIETTRKLEESLVTELEKIFIYWAIDYIKDVLKQEGYVNLQLKPTPIEITSE